jgi:3D (Asp-Asp-Asp) domain-containing protein/cell division protein FtsB
MSNDEAHSSRKPLRNEKKENTGRGPHKNPIVLAALLAVVTMLCVNNVILFDSYEEMRKQVNQAWETAVKLKNGNDALVKQQRNIKKENEYLKQHHDQMLLQNEEMARKMEETRKHNEELVKRNKELTDDNIALQNSLKKAAAAGITPQNYTSFNGLGSRASLDRGKYVGKFLGTAYTPSKEECGNDKGITCSGNPIIPGISIAIDSKYWPFGTVFYIKGLGYAVAMDTGSAIKGKNRFDFAVFDRDFALRLGQKYWEVYLVRMGNGKVNGIKL